MTEFGPQGAPIRVPSEAPPRDAQPAVPAEAGPLSDGCYGQHTPTKNLNCVDRRKPPEEEVMQGDAGPVTVRRDQHAGTVEVRTLSQFVSGEEGETMTTAEFEARGGAVEGEPDPEYPEDEGPSYFDQQATLRAAGNLLTVWEDKAATVLLKSDYQRGQRDNLMACIHDLRGVLGL